MDESKRDPDYERTRSAHVYFCSYSEYTGKSSKSLRAALQGIVILRAGDEVSGMGAMHGDAKFAHFVAKVQAHKAPLIKELEGYFEKLGVSMPEHLKDMINYCTEKKNSIRFG